MTDLQTKLTDIIHKASRAYNGAEVTALVAETEQAFADADYVHCVDVKDFESDPRYVGPDLVLPHVRQRSPEELKAITEALNTPRMTGQEWYNRFENELQQSGALLGHDCTEALDIAKKASGLEQ